jgi:hypothetical protein
MPSSVKRIIDAGVASVSLSLGLQAMLVILLYFGKGNRLLHQVLCCVVIVALIVAISAILSATPRLQSLCFNIPSEISVKSTLMPGGHAPLQTLSPAFIRLTSCVGWLLVAALLGQLSCLAANHRLLAASVQPVGKTPSQLHRVLTAMQNIARHASTWGNIHVFSAGASGISYGWLK